MESWKISILTLKPPSHVRILLYRTWAILDSNVLFDFSFRLFIIRSLLLRNTSRYYRKKIGVIRGLARDVARRN